MNGRHEHSLCSSKLAHARRVQVHNADKVKASRLPCFLISTAEHACHGLPAARMQLYAMMQVVVMHTLGCSSRQVVVMHTLVCSSRQVQLNGW